MIIGVGQYSERVGEPGYAGLSPMDLAGRALSEAISDCAASGSVAKSIDTLAAIRPFEMTRPDKKSPFGVPNNIPRAIAKRVGASPARAILSTAGGEVNQQLVGALAHAIAAGESRCAVVVGAEAVSTVRALTANGETPDWSEEIGGSLEDQGYGIEELIEPALFAHGASGAIPLYALAENARRHKLGLGLEQYRREIGKLFAPFTKVAAANPHSAAPVERTADELATITERNRIVAEPYPRMTAARDQVNQAAAIIIASAGLARELGVPEDKWVHIHAVSAATERKLSQRPDLAGCPASIASVEAALVRAGKRIEEISHLDFYSCFAIPVFNQCDHFGLSVDDPRGLTLTGGLPFFGGAGNNYSAHAIAEAVQRVRGERGGFALVGANGGWMNKYATGIYSCQPADWSANDRFPVLPSAGAKVPLAKGPVDAATVETYTLNRGPKGAEAIFIALSDAGERVVGNADLTDPATALAFESGEPFGRRLALVQDERGRNIGRVAAL